MTTEARNRPAGIPSAAKAALLCFSLTDGLKPIPFKTDDMSKRIHGNLCDELVVAEFERRIPQRLDSLLKKFAARTSGAEAQIKNRRLTAAVNRCATQKQSFFSKL